MKSFMPDVDPQERLRLLRDNCDKSEETTYYRDLSVEELDNKRENLVDNLISISALEDDLDVIKKDFKGKIDPLKSVNKILQTEVHIRKAEVKGMLFHIADHDNSVMNTYDENGDFIKSRRLLPTEKQGKLFIASKTANE